MATKNDNEIIETQLKPADDDIDLIKLRKMRLISTAFLLMTVIPQMAEVYRTTVYNTPESSTMFPLVLLIMWSISLSLSGLLIYFLAKFRLFAKFIIFFISLNTLGIILLSAQGKFQVNLRVIGFAIYFIFGVYLLFGKLPKEIYFKKKVS